MRTLVLLMSLSAGSLWSQIAYRSPHLADPSLLIGYVDSCATFWKKVYDPTYGGYYTNVNRTGGALNTAKHTMNHSRDAYGFVRAFQMTGKTEFLTHARQALSFMYGHSWDTTYGGWYNTLDRQGNPSNKTENKTAFYQHYALLGITAMFEATRDSLDWQWLMKGYANNDAKFWDTRPGYLGYYDYVKYDGTTPTNKSFNATVDAVTTHLLHLSLLTGDAKYLDRLKDVAANMKDRLAASMSGQTMGFVEGWTTDWAWDPSVTMTIMGHVLKTSWCFARLYHLTGDTAYLGTAERLAHHVMDKGYDTQYGGPYKDYNRTTGAMLMWGISDTAKAWWQMEQAVVDGLMLYQITKKQQYLQMADETLNFFMNYFVDHTYGDVYADRAKNGNGIAAWGTNKGNDGKAAYHSIETGYYAYLYQSLMVARTNASLYYMFTPASVIRTFTIRPLTFPDYRIASVTLNDTLLTTVDKANRTVTLPAGKGGIAKVTFEYFSTTGIADVPQQTPRTISLAPNYPNPFNPSTTVEFSLSRDMQARLTVVDLLGREVAVLANERLSAGVHHRTFDAQGLASGVYISRLDAGGTVMARTMLFVK